MKINKEIPRDVLMYKRDKRFEEQLKRVPNWDAHEEDKELVLRFITNLEAQNLTYGRKLFILAYTPHQT